jgi:hypothetical protein
MGIFMLTGITLASCAVDAQDRYLAALSGAAFLETQGGLQVIVTSAGENAVTRFAFDGELTQVEAVRLSAHAGLHDLVATTDGLVALARWDAAVSIDAQTITQGGAHNLVALSGDTLALRATAGLTLDGRTITDTAVAPLGDVTALATLADGRTIAGSAFDTGIALLDAAGTVTDVALAEDGFWHNRVSAIETLRIGDSDFAVVAASGSSSLSVFEIAGDELILTDHEWDNMMTRFSGVAELATLQIGDMTVVAAGGADQGLSLFELTPAGDLVHLRDIVDTFDTTLDGITGLDMIAQGDTAYLAATSERDNGLSVFELEFEFAETQPANVPVDPVLIEMAMSAPARTSKPSDMMRDDTAPTPPAWIADHMEPDMFVL